MAKTTRKGLTTSDGTSADPDLSTAKTEPVSQQMLDAFHSNCKTLEAGIEKTGTRLRIALTDENGAEPFLIRAKVGSGNKMRVYTLKDTAAAMTSALEPAGVTTEGFLEQATAIATAMRTPGIPAPVLWSEPILIISGMASGTVDDWKQRRAFVRERNVAE